MRKMPVHVMTAIVLLGSFLAVFGAYLSLDVQNVVVGTGTIKFQDLEGGFYGIVGDDGRHYDPANLDRLFQVDGLRVQFVVRVLRDQFSFHMWGNLVSIVIMQKLA